jgi:hypothetical protein
MVQASPFCGKPNEDANAHLQNFLELYETIVIWGVTANAIRFPLFPFSLLEKAKQWLYKDKEAVSTWNKCSVVLLGIFPKVQVQQSHCNSGSRPARQEVREPVGPI